MADKPTYEELEAENGTLKKNCAGLASICDDLRASLLAEKKRADDAARKLKSLRADLLKSIG